MRLARSVTTCSVAAPAGTITHATRGGRSARTKSSSSVVPLAPSLAIALTFAGSVAYPTTSWPPRIRRRAMFAPILPSPTIPTCMESSSRLDGPAQLAQAGFHIAPEVHAQRPPPARPEDLEVAERLRRLHHAEGVSPPRYREVLPVVTRDLDEDARIRSALVRLPGRVEITGSEAETRPNLEPIPRRDPGRLKLGLVRLVHRNIREEGHVVPGPDRLQVCFQCRTARDRKSTRLNSSHGYISYAVFCLKKKKPNASTLNAAPYRETPTPRQRTG